MDGVATLHERFPAELLRRRAADFSYEACAARYLAFFNTLSPYRAVVASS